MYDILTAAQAARVIGCNPKAVQEKLKSGQWKFGRVIHDKNKKYLGYEINKRDLADFLKISVWDVNERLEAGK